MEENRETTILWGLYRDYELQGSIPPFPTFNRMTSSYALQKGPHTSASQRMTSDSRLDALELKRSHLKPKDSMAGNNGKYDVVIM